MLERERITRPCSAHRTVPPPTPYSELDHGASELRRQSRTKACRHVSMHVCHDPHKSLLKPSTISCEAASETELLTNPRLRSSCGSHTRHAQDIPDPAMMLFSGLIRVGRKCGTCKPGIDRPRVRIDRDVSGSAIISTQDRDTDANRSPSPQGVPLRTSRFGRAREAIQSTDPRVSRA